MITPSRVLVVYHEHDRRAKPSRLLDLILPLWRDQGMQVQESYGIPKKANADLVFLHVDLSVVPDSYLRFASHYPAVINVDAVDIRKTSFSLNRIYHKDHYPGPVLVKTALNYAGIPERLRHPFYPWNIKASKTFASLRSHLNRTEPAPILRKSDYRIYNSSSEVPDSYYRNKNLIVEKFLPERHTTAFCLREWYFLGKQEFYSAELSDDPIFTTGRDARDLASAPPPEVREIRKKLGLHYGKIDYVYHEGKAVVFDVNKTTGTSRNISSATMEVALILAAGIQDFLPVL